MFLRVSLPPILIPQEEKAKILHRTLQPADGCAGEIILDQEELSGIQEWHSIERIMRATLLQINNKWFMSSVSLLPNFNVSVEGQQRLKYVTLSLVGSHELNRSKKGNIGSEYLLDLGIKSYFQVPDWLEALTQPDENRTLLEFAVGEPEDGKTGFKLITDDPKSPIDHEQLILALASAEEEKTGTYALPDVHAEYLEAVARGLRPLLLS
ncbi:MAG: hypothetical protein ACOCXT_00900 [Candidatus Dojkabacteria bacterium]